MLENVTNSGKNKGIYAVIPAFNEKDTIAAVVASVRSFTPNIVVIDDGSSDGTAGLASAQGAHVIRHVVNSGYDKSISDGFAYVGAQKNACAVFTFDADGQHKADILQQMLLPILNDEADLVVGTRPFTARLAEKMLALYTNRRFGIKDPLCGLKAYKIEVFRDIGWFDRINSIGTELMLRAIIKGYRVKQIPIPIKRRVDRSRFGQAIKGNYKIFMALLRIMVRI